MAFDHEADRRVAARLFSEHRPSNEWALDIIWLLDEDYERKREVGGICQIVSEHRQLLYIRDHAEVTGTEKLQ